MAQSCAPICTGTSTGSPSPSWTRPGAPTLITRLTSDANQAQASINLTLRLLLRSPFIVLGAIAMAFTIDARLTLIFIGATALLGLCVFFVMRATIPLYRRIQSRLDRVSRLTRESLSGARVIRAFSRQASEKADYEAETASCCARRCARAACPRCSTRPPARL